MGQPTSKRVVPKARDQRGIGRFASILAVGVICATVVVSFRSSRNPPSDSHSEPRTILPADRIDLRDLTWDGALYKTLNALNTEVLVDTSRMPASWHAPNAIVDIEGAFRALELFPLNNDDEPILVLVPTRDLLVDAAVLIASLRPVGVLVEDKETLYTLADHLQQGINTRLDGLKKGDRKLVQLLARRALTRRLLRSRRMMDGKYLKSARFCFAPSSFTGDRQSISVRYQDGSGYGWPSEAFWRPSPSATVARELQLLHKATIGGAIAAAAADSKLRVILSEDISNELTVVAMMGNRSRERFLPTLLDTFRLRPQMTQIAEGNVLVISKSVFGAGGEDELARRVLLQAHWQASVAVKRLRASLTPELTDEACRPRGASASKLSEESFEFLHEAVELKMCGEIIAGHMLLTRIASGVVRWPRHSRCPSLDMSMSRS